jgi:hypothetical protein
VSREKQKRVFFAQGASIFLFFENLFPCEQCRVLDENLSTLDALWKDLNGFRRDTRVFTRAVCRNQILLISTYAWHDLKMEVGLDPKGTQNNQQLTLCNAKGQKNQAKCRFF